jgi:hypothetical protein
MIVNSMGEVRRLNPNRIKLYRFDELGQASIAWEACKSCGDGAVFIYAFGKQFGYGSLHIRIPDQAELSPGACNELLEHAQMYRHLPGKEVMCWIEDMQMEAVVKLVFEGLCMLNQKKIETVESVNKNY